MLQWNGSIWKHITDNAGTESNSGLLCKHLHIQNPNYCEHEKKKCALQFVKHCDLFQRWTVTRLGPDPDRLVFEMSSASIGPEFPQLPKVTDLTWEGKRDTWLPALYSASSCAPLPYSSLLTQLCYLLNWFNKLMQQKTCHGVVLFSLCGLSVREKQTRDTGRKRDIDE